MRNAFQTFLKGRATKKDTVMILIAGHDHDVVRSAARKLAERFDLGVVRAKDAVEPRDRLGFRAAKIGGSPRAVSIGGLQQIERIAVQDQIDRASALGITQNMGLAVGWRSQEHITQGDATLGAAGSNYSYRVRSLDADLHMRF